MCSHLTSRNKQGGLMSEALDTPLKLGRRREVERESGRQSKSHRQVAQRVTQDARPHMQQIATTQEVNHQKFEHLGSQASPMGLSTALLALGPRNAKRQGLCHLARSDANRSTCAEATAGAGPPLRKKETNGRESVMEGKQVDLAQQFQRLFLHVRRCPLPCPAFPRAPSAK